MVKHAVDTHFVTSKYNSNLTQAEKKKEGGRRGGGEGKRKSPVEVLKGMTSVKRAE